MRLTLTLIAAAEGGVDPPPGAPGRLDFDTLGGSIGRGADNDWTLPDPDRTLSKTHCRIGGENGRFRLTDLSTNGVFLNDAPDRVPRGDSVPLSDGDTVRLGRFAFRVTIREGAAAGWEPADAEPDAFARMLLGQDTAPVDPPASGAEDPLDRPAAEAAENPFAAVFGPDGRRLPARDEGFVLGGFGPSERDDAPVDRMAFRAPRPGAADPPAVGVRTLSQTGPCLCNRRRRGDPTRARSMVRTGSAWDSPVHLQSRETRNGFESFRHQGVWMPRALCGPAHATAATLSF